MSGFDLDFLLLIVLGTIFLHYANTSEIQVKSIGKYRIENGEDLIRKIKEREKDFN